MDRSAKRIVVAHYAFTRDRENALRGGWTVRELYEPEFYEIAPGQEKVLRYSAGKNLEPGRWHIEGKVSVVLDPKVVAGHEGQEAAAIAKSDSLIGCVGKVLTGGSR